MRLDLGIVEAVGSAVEARREELVELCARLVGARSTNPPGRTVEVAEILSGFLASRALAAEVVRAEDEAPNVVSGLATGRPGRHVIFNAHMDTMQPGNEAAWSVPIHRLTRRDGRLYGLGMGNMKGGLAAMVLAFDIVRDHLPRLGGRLSLTAVPDEVMFGTRGTPFLLERRPDLYGDVMISAEGPGDMGFAVAEKGLLWVDAEAQGPAGHSSRALRGETAVARLARFLTQVDAFNDEFVPVPAELAGIEGGQDDAGLRLSASAGVIRAGEVRSLIPDAASAQIDLRLPPGVSLAAITARLEALAAECGGISLSYPKGWAAGWAALDDDVVLSLADIAERVRGRPTRFVVRLPGSDARYWRARGVPSVCYGPQPTLSAGIDDYANEQDVVDCAKIYALTAIDLMGPPA